MTAISDADYGRIISKNLKRIMYDHQKTQADISHDLSISKATVSSWVNGSRIPRMDKIDLLCHYFNVTRYDIMEDHEVSVKYYLSTQYIETLKRHKARHAAKGNGFGYEIIDIDGVSNAIVVGGMGRERNLIIDNRLTNFTPITHIKGEVNREGIRRMTPREWARLQGFPDKFKIVVADASAYKQFGNSVAIPAIQATAEQELKTLKII